VADATIVASELSHACLGFEAIGLCNYDPAQPFAIYFAPGAAVGALAFTLAVQQLLKPVYRFRLAVRHLTLVIVSASLPLAVPFGRSLSN